MDYLLRDAKNVGINYGSYETDYLVSCMRCSDDKEPILYLTSKGLNPAEYYLLAKYYYYTQILYHPKREIYEILANILFQIALEYKLAPGLNELYDRIKRDHLFYAHFDDNWFTGVVDKMAESPEILGKYPWVKKFAYSVRFRRHKEVIRLKSEEVKIVDEWEAKDYEDKLRREGYADFVTVQDITDKTVLRKLVLVDIAESEKEIKDKATEADPGLHGGYILIDQGDTRIPIQMCEASLINILSRQKVFMLREYDLHLN